MQIFWVLFSCFIISVTAKNGKKQCEIIRAGYIAGQSGMPKLNKTSCLNDELLEDSHLSSALECARTCRPGQKPRTCYYKFMIERYSTSGQACQLCTPNITNTICPNCQCVIGDGTERAALTVNRMMPGPSIQVCLGDYIVVDVINHVSESAVTIHWHGMLQHGSQYYDGVPYVTQCPIPSSSTFRYQFYAHDPGTHFWHAHTGLHKMDGVFGSLIVREPAKNEPNANLYNFDLANHVIVVNDWMTEEATARYPGRLNGTVGQHADSILINGKGRYTNPNNNATTSTSLEVITVDPNRRYRFRLVNAFCTTCAAEFSIQGHNLTVIATDGQPTRPVVVDSIISSAGERYDFVLNANQTPGAYWIRLRGLIDCADIKLQALAVLQYVNASATLSTPEPKYDEVLPQNVVLNPLDGNCSGTRPDAICISNLRNARQVESDILTDEPDTKIFVSIGLQNLNPVTLFEPNRYQSFLVPLSGSFVAETINNINYETPPSPPLSQLDDLPVDQFCNSDNLPKHCNSTYCSCTHVIEIPLHSVVEIAIVDTFQVPGLHHPFHLHGYAYNVVAMDQPLGPFNGSNGITADYVKQLDNKNQIERNFDSPPGKDTIGVPNNGFVLIRFHASNPGFWLFHCHITYHQLNGMEMIYRVGDESDLPPKPKNFPRCGNYMPRIRNEQCSSKRKRK
ncbi:uncharacterized protein LOC143352472 [Halictus rubicundus]|uniref:uncharacterized protein LOC143352472 n=1 Tax=Halictus rubicundus TaxID=77578 RepID=UPI00403734CF